MKFKIAILLLLSAMMVSAQADSIAPVEEEPLKLKTSIVDVGTISGDSIVEARFTIYNTGSEPMSILRINSDCNCTVPSYSREPIAPGDSVDFEVRYDPRGYRWGQFRRTLRIRTTAPKPYLTAILKGSIARKYKR